MALSRSTAGRLTTIVGVVAVLLLVVALFFIVRSCNEPEGAPLDQITAPENGEGAPGVAPE